MSAPQHTATKAPGKPDPKHDEGKDLRRAYEHQGRVEALRPALGKHREDIDALTKLGKQELSTSHYKDAADLFRAAEHFSFALLMTDIPVDHSDATLTENLQSEFESKLKKVQEHWEQTDALAGIYGKAVADAQKAFHDGAHGRALELVRAAEALAHVHVHGSKGEKTAA